VNIALNKPAFKLGDFPVGIKSVRVILADGSRIACECRGLSVEGKTETFKYACQDSLVNIHIFSGESTCVLGFSAVSLRSLNSNMLLEIELDVEKPNRILALTTHRDAARYYSSAFGYYNQTAIDREPKGSKPPDDPEYPPKLGYIEHEEYKRGYPCWTYPVILEEFEDLPYYSIFLLAEYEDKYMALLTFTDKTTTYVEPKLTLKVFSGKEVREVDLCWIASISVDSDPYMAIKQTISLASSSVTFKPREIKRRPLILDKIGWCSWNALLTEDLSHENIIKIVSGLLNRGLRLGWVIIDDGWQDEIKREGWPRRILRKLSANERFPKGLRGVVEDLKRLNVDLVGLWHTINVHWSGFEEDLSREIGVKSYFSKFNESYVPPPTMNEAFEFYRKFFSWVKDNGVDFVKVDNQWVIHALYYKDLMVGEASRNIELAMQAAAYANGLDILNCMSMAPENYSNFLFSNVMRVSIDYVPFWKADAKLHTIFSAYNALLFSHIAYPDYDMFMSYDPYAKVHAVARILSGGPIYITDRNFEKTNIDLLKRFVLPDGRLIKVDEPALPTKDVLFRDPYNEPILLKIASRVKESILVAVFNVNRKGGRIEDSISLNALPFNIKRGDYAYHKLFKDECGLLKSGENLRLSLDELDVEIISLAPVENNRAVIGLKEYFVPRYPISLCKSKGGAILVESKAEGTLLYYANGSFSEVRVKEGTLSEI
jgi:hypothetical protein